jgi:hypothetical protein
MQCNTSTVICEVKSSVEDREGRNGESRAICVNIPLERMGLWSECGFGECVALERIWHSSP